MALKKINTLFITLPALFLIDIGYVSYEYLITHSFGFNYLNFIMLHIVKFSPLINLIVVLYALFFWKHKKFNEKKYDSVFQTFDIANDLYVQLRYLYHVHHKYQKVINITDESDFKEGKKIELLNLIKNETTSVEKECFKFMTSISVLDTFFDVNQFKEKSNDLREKFHDIIEAFDDLFHSSESAMLFTTNSNLTLDSKTSFSSLEKSFIEYRKFVRNLLPRLMSSF